MNFSFNHLSDAALIELSRAWLFDGTLRAALERYALLAALIPELTEAHEAMLGLSAPAPGAPTALAFDEADDAHDAASRGVFQVLTGVYALTDDPKIDALLDFLYPEKLRINNRSYVEEAGEGARIAANLTAEHEGLLSAIKLHDGSTLLDHVRERLAQAARLGDLVEQRVQAEAMAKPVPREATRGGVRRRWIQVARGLLQSLTVARVTEDDAKLLTAKLRTIQA